MIILLQWLTGMGVLALTGFRAKRSIIFPLAFLLGMFTHNIAFFLCDVIGVGIGLVPMLVSALVCVVATHAMPSRTKALYNFVVSKPAMNLRMHDVVVLTVGASLGYYIIWAAWFWPVTPFDAMAGIDLVAREAVQESTINNRVFSDPALHGQLSNQPFYAPFAMLLQVQYRLMQFMYGQIWVAVVAVMFYWFMWSSLRQFCNPFIANVLWLLLILTPEMLGYTYLLQTDFLNASYFAIAVILLALSVRDKNQTMIGAVAFAFAASCWARSETLIVVLLCCILYVPIAIKTFSKSVALKQIGFIGLCSAFAFGLWNLVYVRMFLPVQPNLTQELGAVGLGRLTQVTSDFFVHVVASVDLWGIAFIVFCVAVVVNLVVTRTVGNHTLLLWIVGTFIGLIIIGAMFSSAIVEQTLRRGIFKIIPLLFAYIAALPLMQRWSDRLSKWETQV